VGSCQRQSAHLLISPSAHFSMKIARQFERRGPLWLPRYAVGGSVSRRTVPIRGEGKPSPYRRERCPAPDGIGRRHPPLKRFERWRQRSQPLPQLSWSWVNGKAVGSTAAVTSYTLTLGFTPSAGTLLTVCAATNNTAITAMSISDNSSGPADSWTATTSMGAWGNGTVESWACNVTTGTAPTSITITLTGGSAYIFVGADNYSGGPNPFVQDGSGVQNAQSGTTAPTASFTTGSQAGDLLWTCELTSASETTVTVGNPFTMRSQGDGNRINTSDDGTSSSLSANTQYTVTYTLSGSTNTITALIGFQTTSVAFQPDEDLWQWNGETPPDTPVTVFG